MIDISADCNSRYAKLVLNFDSISPGYVLNLWYLPRISKYGCNTMQFIPTHETCYYWYQADNLNGRIRFVTLKSVHHINKKTQLKLFLKYITPEYFILFVAHRFHGFNSMTHHELKPYTAGFIWIAYLILSLLCLFETS